ncbi:MAG TPA: PAS domain S-box protein [bacterium]|nr:PAS domain S-box protein [bacterium]HPN44234.1 PAS domain S-box protein [bacterium]
MTREILHILEIKEPEIIAEWETRVKQLFPNWEEERLRRLVYALKELLVDYLAEFDVEVIIKHVEKIINTFYLALNEAPKLIVNSLLVSRYIILSFIAKEHSQNYNSLNAFGQINDLYEPLIQTISVQFKARSAAKVEQLPKNYTRALEKGMLSLDFAGVGLFMLDKNLNFIHWSAGLDKMYHITTREALGQNLLTILPFFKKEKKLYIAIMQAVEENREADLFEVKHKIGKREERIINYKIAPLRDENDRPIGVSVLSHDVTEHIKGQLTLKRYEQYFENILNDAADAIIILNENDRIVMWNNAAELLYGWPEEEVIGKTISLIVPDDPQSQEEIENINQIVREKGFVRNLRSHRLTRDGRKIVIDISRTAILNDRGEYIGSSVIARDMTQQEQLRQQLIQSEKLSAVGTLAAGIAHEVGSPLNSISSLTQLLSFKVDDEDVKDKITLIRQNIDRISRTVKTLVDFSKPIAHNVEMIYLNSVIEHVIRIIKYDKRLKHQNIETVLEPKIPLVTASFDQVLQVFINICLNAADAMENVQNGTLIIKTWFDAEKVYTSITDNGSGIPEDKIAHIFEPFYTTKAKGKGTGLGLWVSYNIISSFNGTISVDSRQGEYSTFTIALPQYKKDK